MKSWPTVNLGLRLALLLRLRLYPYRICLTTFFAVVIGWSCIGVLTLSMLLQKPARILRPTRHWDSNLDWNAGDVLQLTLGEEEVQWELKGSDVLSMSINDIKPTWKVRTPSCLKSIHLMAWDRRSLLELRSEV